MRPEQSVPLHSNALDPPLCHYMSETFTRFTRFSLTSSVHGCRPRRRTFYLTKRFSLTTHSLVNNNRRFLVLLAACDGSMPRNGHMASLTRILIGRVLGILSARKDIRSTVSWIWTIIAGHIYTLGRKRLEKKHKVLEV